MSKPKTKGRNIFRDRLAIAAAKVYFQMRSVAAAPHL